MSNEKECSNCAEFKHNGGADNRGTCTIGIRGGITHGQYICSRWRAYSGRISDPLHGQAAQLRNDVDKGNKKPDGNAGNRIQTNELRAKRDIEKLK